MLKFYVAPETPVRVVVSVLFNESKLLKYAELAAGLSGDDVSVLFNESKLLKFISAQTPEQARVGFQYSSTSRNC